LIESCEHCHTDDADIPFDWILDRVTGSESSVTDYILEEPAKCPNCRREIFEKTLVEPGLMSPKLISCGSSAAIFIGEPIYAKNI
jgi:hypothetical protein